MPPARIYLLVRADSAPGCSPRRCPGWSRSPESGHQAVVGRQVGRPAWERTAGSGPVAALLVDSKLAASVRVPDETGAARDWLAAWHDAVLAETDDVAALDDYPSLRPSPDAVPAEA